MFVITTGSGKRKIERKVRDLDTALWKFAQLVHQDEHATLTFR